MTTNTTNTTTTTTTTTTTDIDINTIGTAIAIDTIELTTEEMDEITGGYKKPAEKKGYEIYKIESGDTLIRIANKKGIKDWKKILEWNPKITNPRLIRAGDYLYIKA